MFIEGLLQAILDQKQGIKSKLVLTFEKYLHAKDHTLGKGEVLIVGDVYPEGFELNDDREIQFSPRLVTLTGPERYIIQDLKNVVLPTRERLLECVAPLVA